MSCQFLDRIGIPLPVVYPLACVVMVTGGVLVITIGSVLEARIVGGLRYTLHVKAPCPVRDAWSYVCSPLWRLLNAFMLVSRDAIPGPGLRPVSLLLSLVCPSFTT